jgi:hypothetical protein
MAMREDLQDAAKQFREQLSAGIQPNIGAMVLLVNREGVGCSSNIPKPAAIAILEQLLRSLKTGDSNLIVPPSGIARA